MPTKDELAGQAIEKTQELNEKVLEQGKEIEFLKKHCEELRATEKEHKKIIQSLKTIRAIVYLLIPFLLAAVVGVAASYSSLIKQGEAIAASEKAVEKNHAALEKVVEKNYVALEKSMEKNHAVIENRLAKLDDRLQSTRDQILIRFEKRLGNFVKVEHNRLFLKGQLNGAVQDYGISPNVQVVIKDKPATLADLKEGMTIVIDIGRSIDRKEIVWSISDDVKRFEPPPVKELPKTAK